MRALLMKDFFTVMKQLKMYVVMIIFFAAIPQFNMSISAFAAVYAGMLPFSALAYDEQSKWDQLVMTMPFTRRQIVLSKYVMGYLFCGGVVVLMLAFNALYAALQVTVQTSVMELLISATYGPLAMALVLPMMYRMGSEKGRMIIVTAMALVFAVSAVLFSRVIPEGVQASIESTSVAVVCGIWGVTVAVNALSIFLSERWYGYRTR